MKNFEERTMVALYVALMTTLKGVVDRVKERQRKLQASPARGAEMLEYAIGAAVVVVVAALLFAAVRSNVAEKIGIINGD